MGCPIVKDIFKTEAFKELRRRIGSNEHLFDLYSSYTVAGKDDEGNPLLTEGFQNYLDSHGITDFSFDKKESADIIDKYVRNEYKSMTFIESTQPADATRLKEVISYGYSSLDARLEAKGDCVTLGIDYIQTMRRRGLKIVGDIKTEIKNGILRSLNREATKRICAIRGIEYNGKSPEVKAIADRVKKEGAKYIREELGKDYTLQNRNFLALYIETHDNEEGAADNFFRSVLMDNKFSEYKIRVFDEFGEAGLVNDQGENVDDDTETTVPGEEERPAEDNVENAVAMFDHSGTKANFMEHVDEEIKTYFYTLPKLIYPKQVDGKWVTEKGSLVGMMEVMDANACSTMLFREADFTNWQRMIASIKKIAETYKGFEAFAKLAKDLENNPDFAFKFYCTFGKEIFSKIETVVENGDAKTNQSNKRSNKLTALSFDMLNSVRSTVTNMISVNVDEMLVRAFPNNVALKDPNSEAAKNLIKNLTDLMSFFFPTIDKHGISSFLFGNKNTNGNVNVYSNYEALYNRLKELIASGKKSVLAYQERQADIAKKNAEIEKLKKQKDFSFTKLAKLQKELDEIFDREYLDKDLEKPVMDIARNLAPFVAISVDLNSRNVYGNLSSDVLNNNMLTNFMNMLTSTLNHDNSTDEKSPLVKYGEFKLAGKQHLLSNILLEHWENGKRINKGLFKIDKNGAYVPTDYATQLLKVELFSGATSFDTGKNILYKEMSGIDYLTTAFLNFVSESNKLDEGKYFMRIPSDAPKTFIITAPKYSIDGLNVLGDININHPLFKQFKQIFKQELLDMAVALDTIFEVDKDGVVRRDPETRKPIIKPEFRGEGINRLYKVYHYNDSILKTGEDGLEHLTGRVFQSVKLTVFDTDNNVLTNYGQDLINAVFDFLYGGTTKSLKVIRDGNGQIVDVDTSRVLDADTNQTIDTLINDTIKRFIKQYCDEAIKRIEPAKRFILDTNTKLKNSTNQDDFYNAVAEFVLNTHLMYSSFDDLFEGDSRFYRDSQDFLKRAKEVQGSGVPYGITDYSRTFMPARKKNRIPDVLLNNKEKLTSFVKSVGSPEGLVDTLYGIGQFDTFHAVTVKNTIRRIPGTEVGSKLYKKLVKELKASGLTEEKAKAKAEDMLSRYDKTKVNDAQSYITFEEWVRRISARGQLGRYLPTIVRILDESQPLTPEVIDEFVQVQKNFYYDLHFDEELGIEVPRQIKNAEFVLVPRFIRGTELEEVYNIMKANNIDQLNTEETSKAGKHNVLTLWDNEGKINTEDFTSKVKNSKVVEVYSYNNLYTQQETPQHVAAKNKAGIQVMKKIIDNIPEGHPLYGKKQLFMALYSAKVFKSYEDLMDELNVPRDENGNIIFDEDGYIKGLNYDLLYSKFREQADRLGTNSNLDDYLTLTDATLENGIRIPKMPNYFNGTSNKIENIAQALFNSAITRQKLPGFHAAQITNVGMTSTDPKPFKKVDDDYKGRKELSRDEYDKLSDDAKKHYEDSRVSYSEDLRYHPNGENYIEIKLPKSAFGFAKGLNGEYLFKDKELLQQLVDAGLDKVIGYRIPTEGKQSICVMKVVGFIDDGCGSTIVVPDGWVAQTGSDFDIDSVYGIQHATYIDKEGHIRKVEFKEHLAEADRINRWRRMVRRAVGRDFRNIWEHKDERIKKAIRKAEVALRKNRARLQTIESKAYDKLTDREQSSVRLIHEQQNRRATELDAETYAILLRNEAMLLGKRRKVTDTLKAYIDAITAIADSIENIDSKTKVGSAISDEIKAIQAEEDKLYTEYAKELGLKSLDYYKTADENFVRTNDELDNGIVNTMLEILQDERTVEENLLTSNFEDIKDSRAKYLGEDAAKASRSPYNIFDQADQMSDAVSGLILKGFSVTRDNLCSIGNATHAILKDSPIVVFYSADDYSETELKKRFGENNVKKIGNRIRVTHTRFGWSEDNRNVDGHIITAYSSETTAHILDAVKEGNIPNVNDFSFGVYKTFVDVGSNYDVAVGFMMQPAVTRIINYYNANKSIYTNGRVRPIVDAFKDLAALIPSVANAAGKNPVRKFNIKKIIEELNKNVGLKAALQRIAGVEDIEFTYSKGIISFLTKDEDGKDVPFDIPIDARELKRRIDLQRTSKTPVEESAINVLAYDMAIVAKFSQLYSISQDITQIAQVLNPDKFGAKQSIFATNKVFDDIVSVASKDSVLLTSNGIALLNAIYPDIEKGVETFASSEIKTSVYPPLYHFLKFASAPSIIINRNLFETQEFAFRNAISRISEIYGTKRVLTEKLYKDFEKHVLGYLYTQIPFIAQGLNYNKDTNAFEVDFSTDTFTESQRIRGFNSTPDFTFDVEDFYDPKDKEIEVWKTLSPAQKVLWLQQNLKEPGIFGFIKAELRNENRNRGNSHTIEFTENQVSIEDIYTMFDDAWHKKNAFIKLALADIIKYAFQVEGFRMSQKAINKIIQNNALMENMSEGGTGIVSYMRQKITSLGKKDIDHCLDTYVRSKMPAEVARVSLGKDSPLRLQTYVVKKEDSETTFSEGFYTAAKDDKDALIDAGLAYWDEGDIRVVDYFITRGKNPVVYKVKDHGEWIAAYPLNKLEPNEYTMWSANPKNNTQFYDPVYYEGRIAGTIQFEERKKYGAPVIKQIKTPNTLYLDRPKNETEATAFKTFTDAVEANAENITTKRPYYTLNPAVASHLVKRGKIYGSLQIINDKAYIVYKKSLPERLRKYLKGGPAENVSISELPSMDALFADIISKLRSYNYSEKFPGDLNIAAVVEATESDQSIVDFTTMNSSITESPINPIKVIHAEAGRGNKYAIQARDTIVKFGILPTEESVSTNLHTVYQALREYAIQTSDDLINRAKTFIQNEDGTYISIDKPEAIKAIRNNRAKRIEYLKLILDAKKLESLFSDFETLPIDDLELRPAIEDIKEIIGKKLRSSLFNDTWTLFVNEYLKKLSTNPLVQQDIITLTDGYYSSGTIEALINDTQEMPNPLIQVITKNVMADIRAKEANAERWAREFRKSIEDMIAEAKSKGIEVNLGNVIDKDGRLTQPYVQQFLDDYAELRRKIDELKADPNYGEGSIEHLRAEIELDQWMIDNVEQAYKNSYYDEMGILHEGYYEELLRRKKMMVNNYPEIYSAYRKLLARRRQLRSHIAAGELDAAYQEELDRISKEISALSSEFVSDGTNFYAKPKYTEVDVSQKINTREEALALRDYIKRVKEIHEKYNSSEENIGFREDLERNLRIVEAWEARDAESRLTTHPIILDEIEEYRRAKKWLKDNARYVEDEETLNLINAAFRALGAGSGSIASKRLREVAKHLEDYYDEYGRGDGRKLSAVQQEALRKLQDKENADRANAVFNTAILLNSARRAPQVYTKQFYRDTTPDLERHPEFVQIVEKINNILRKHYDAAHRSIVWTNVTREEYDQLKQLYKDIATIKDNQHSTEFAKKYIEWSDGTAEFEIAESAARLGNTIDMDRWLAVNTETITLEDGTKKVIPNRFIYSYQRPTVEGLKIRDKKTKKLLYLDEIKTKALETIRHYCTTEPTRYYYDELERRRKQEAEGIIDADGRNFQKWYEDNHTYNPINGSYSPIKCWMQSTVTGGKGTWEANFNQSHTTPKAEFVNPKHKEGLTLGLNYKVGSKYDSNVEMNEYERQIHEKIYNLLITLSRNNVDARRFFEKGNLPVRAKSAERNLKYYLKEAAKLTGWIEGTDGESDMKNNMDYNNDAIPAMPMSRRLENLEGERVKLIKPVRSNYETEAEYNAEMLKYKDAIAKQQEEDDEYNRMMRDNDWLSVLEEFIIKAEHYNAVQDNKYMLYYGQQMLKNMKNYIDYTGNEDMPIDKQLSRDGQVEYQTEAPRKEYEQYTNWMRRLILNQWRNPNKRFTKIASIAQSLTSANFMMMNVRGGIANVTLGETQILMETFAREYFGAKEYAEGKGVWLANVANFIINRHSETSTTVADAIIKYMNVVDFDEIKGVPRIDVDPATYLTRLRNFMFSPQTIGEHFMQNGVLFTMLKSHKLYKNDSAENGRTSWVALSRADVIRQAHEKALLDILDKDQTAAYEEEKRIITSDPNITKEFAWYKVDITTKFAMEHLDKEKQDEFIKRKKEREEEILKEFDEAPNVYDQLALTKDGKLGFKDGSILQSLDVKQKDENGNVKDEEVTEAYQILAELKGRVISVNKKIHGVYDRMGSAQIEKYWWGPLVMQYHKHIVPNVLKRWRRHGYYNEERGTIEKGCHIALMDFLAIPFNKHKKELNLTNEQADTITGIQETFKDVVDFLFNIKHYYDLQPEYEKANIRRNLGDIVGVLSAICFAIALRALGDDDEDDRLYNLALYECDRLASETMQFNPLGAITEAKKLWSNPVAVQSIVNDIMSSMGIISQMIMEGEDFDPYYSSGKYAGEHKLAVRIRRRIPIWRGIDTIINIADDNHYYKLGDNMLSIVPVKRIAEWINE